MARSISARFSPLVEPAHLPLLDLLHNSFMSALPSSTDNTSVPSVRALSWDYPYPEDLKSHQELMIAVQRGLDRYWHKQVQAMQIRQHAFAEVMSKGQPSSFSRWPQRAATPVRRKTETA
jgi:hypothetical protein